jgi:hypothetical protein
VAKNHKLCFNPGEIVECTDSFTGDTTTWSRESFGAWARRNGVSLTRMPSRRYSTATPPIMIRQRADEPYSEHSGNKPYTTGGWCAIRLLAPGYSRRGGRIDVRDTLLHRRRD